MKKILTNFFYGIGGLLEENPFHRKTGKRLHSWARLCWQLADGIA